MIGVQTFEIVPLGPGSKLRFGQERVEPASQIAVVASNREDALNSRLIAQGAKQKASGRVGKQREHESRKYVGQGVR